VGTNGGSHAVIVFASWSYRHILTNWLLLAPPRVSQQLFIHAYGFFYPVFLWLSGHRVVWVSMRRPTRAIIWRDRVKAILGFLVLSVEVVVCDADAVVLEDFTDDINAIAGDLLVSQGVGHPKVAFKAWDGFTLCCGFAVYRPTERTINLMRKVSAHSLGKSYNDQYALNSVLLENGLVWDPPSTQYILEDVKRKIRCFPESLAGTIADGDLSGLRVVLLPHTSYRRMPNYIELADPKVFHPYPVLGKGKGNNRSLKDNGLWRV